MGERQGMYLKINHAVSYFMVCLLFSCNITDSPEEERNAYLESGSSSAPTVLLIGSSYFNDNDLPMILKKLSESANEEIKISTSITNGLYLSDHAIYDYTLNKIKEKQWDFVVLQGSGSVIAYPGMDMEHMLYPALVALKEKILKNDSLTQIIYCMPWAFEDGMTWQTSGGDDYAEMQQKIYENTLRYSKNIGFTISPVGWAWNRVLFEKEYPLHYLHSSDYNHPSQKGSYLMACVIHTTLFKKSTEGVSFSGNISDDDASYFQEVGSEVVLDDLQLWNIE